MGRAKKVSSPDMMWQKFQEYMEQCDNHTALVTDFSQRNSEHVCTEIRKPVSYKIKGFALFLGMTEQNFYETYASDPKFESVIARIRDICEIDTVEKFETGQLPTQIAGLLLSNYGYSTKTDTNITGSVPVVISGGDELES